MTTVTWYYPPTNPPPVSCVADLCGGLGGFVVGVLVFLVWGSVLVYVMRRGGF